MSRGSNDLVGLWAGMKRQQQRQREADAREQRARDREERAQRQRIAQNRREYREAQARQRTEELDAQVEALQGLLEAGCRSPVFTADSLLRTAQVSPFAPGPLSRPVQLPDPMRYRAPSGLPADRRAQAQTEARARYESDRRTAQAAEEERRRQLAVYQREYERSVEAQREEVRRHNAGVAEVTARVRRAEPDAVVEFFSAALYASAAWPDGFPRQVSAAYDLAERQLVLDWELPRYDIVPGVKWVRYLPSVDRDKETLRPAGQRRALYREVLAQCMLLVLHELFAADGFGVLASVTLNGFVDDRDPATGRQVQTCLSTVMAERSAFDGLRLEQVEAVSCLTGALKGQLASRPDQLVAVRPVRTPQELGNRVVRHGDDADPDLFDMEPVAFEGLVAELFRAMGMQAVTTQRSNDGGVDVDALDPTPIRGGKIVVQVKRYRATVPPTAVRDLYGTVHDRGANKGVLVTTSKFGPGSHTFANGKPLELVSGSELVDLLHRHGLRGRLGSRDAAAAPAMDPVPEPDDYNVLGMSWSGDVSLDVCALVCHGERVLGDEHFVFFNNPRTPDGSVRVLDPAAPDRAALRVAFDLLPTGANRLVLAAAVDPETDAGMDLSSFTGAEIRLRDPSLAELGRLTVSDGRPGETALVLGSFRRRSNGDWDFVVGGKGYAGGLEELLPEYGIDVD